MIDLERRLGELGDLLAIDATDLSEAVTAAAGAPGGRSSRITPLRAAAIVVLVVAVAVAIVPSARDAVAGWLGFDRVSIERRDDAVPVRPPPTITAPSGPDPLDETVVTFDATPVLVGTIDGRLSDVFLAKTVGIGDAVLSLDIDGMPAIWIEEPHDVVIERGGSPVVERVAGATLLWQDGDVLRRAEGFATLAEAVAFVRSR